MEVLFFILMIIFVAVTSGKGKNQKGGQAAQKQALEKTLKEARERKLAEKKIVAARAPQPTHPARAAQPAMSVPIARPTVPAVKPTEPAFVPMMSGEGEALDDGEGCVGGSMPHEHTEGETREEHERHLEALHTREAGETLAAQAAIEARELNIHRLRRAVIMAEVLDRPKALRRR